MKEMKIEDYLKKIIKYTGLSKEAILKLAQEKKEELKGLLSDDAALFVIGKGFGVDLESVTEENLIKSDPNPNNFYNFYDVGFATKNDFINFLKEKLYDSPESFRDEAFPLVRDVRDRPDLIAIIKSEVLKAVIEKINDFKKFEELPGEMAYYFHNRTWDDLYNVGPEKFFRQTILETDISTIYIVSEGEGISDPLYIAGAENAENAIDLVIYKEFKFPFPEITEAQNFQDFGGTDMSEYLSYWDLDIQIANALKYLELKMYLKQKLDLYDAKDLQKDERYQI